MKFQLELHSSYQQESKFITTCLPEEPDNLKSQLFENKDTIDPQNNSIELENIPTFQSVL